MSTFAVAGPCPIYVGTGTSFAFEFLGFGRQGVRGSFQAKFGRVESDVAGPELWSDGQFLGEEATFSLELSRKASAVLAKLEARCSSATSITAGALPGLTPAAVQGAGLGTLMVAEGAAVPLCIVNPYQSQKSGQSSEHPCYVFGAAWLADYDREHSVAVTYPRLSFQCINIVNYVTGALQLYTNTLPGSLPGIS